jgi:sulfide dehydrogenase cytochrome subunit
MKIHQMAWVPLLLAAMGATAQTAVDRQARVWAASCAACHGTDGRAQVAAVPLAGRDAELTYRALIELKSGQRPAATVMHQHAKGYTDDELKRIAAFFATIKP